jgi:hypothetical protein
VLVRFYDRVQESIAGVNGVSDTDGFDRERAT